MVVLHHACSMPTYDLEFIASVPSFCADNPAEMCHVIVIVCLYRTYIIFLVYHNHPARCSCKIGVIPHCSGFKSSFHPSRVRTVVLSLGNTTRISLATSTTKCAARIKSSATRFIVGHTAQQHYMQLVRTVLQCYAWQCSHQVLSCLLSRSLTCRRFCRRRSSRRRMRSPSTHFVRHKPSLPILLFHSCFTRIAALKPHISWVTHISHISWVTHISISHGSLTYALKPHISLVTHLLSFHWVGTQKTLLENRFTQTVQPVNYWPVCLSYLVTLCSRSTSMLRPALTQKLCCVLLSQHIYVVSSSCHTS